ncbi:MAG: tRNA (guanosine(37)-N1)-methyltransferase TrmD [Gammaproteobacteria bacterium]
MRIDVVTLFPELVATIGDYGITGRAVERGLLSIECWNPRDYAHDRHRTVDDRSYGGGPGMVMKVEPLRDAIRAARVADRRPVRAVYLTPQGRRVDQAWVAEAAQAGRLLLVAGRYEGVDERVLETEIDEELSLGDFVLSGGEPAAMAVIDAIARLLPGALGDAASADEDSFTDGLLDHPHYTRPEVLDGVRVPKVLVGGDHAAVRRWRLREALGRTWQRRPDLIEARGLDEEEKALLAEYIAAHNAAPQSDQ